MKMTVFWDTHYIVKHTLTDVSEVFIASFIRAHHRPDDGGINLRNIGQLLRDYTAQHPRRLSSSTVKLLYDIYRL
jgi:hypothetical protein